MATSRSVELEGVLATYRVVEEVDDDGHVRLAFTSSNPPRGLDRVVWAWNGNRRALESARG